MNPSNSAQPQRSSEGNRAPCGEHRPSRPLQEAVDTVSLCLQEIDLVGPDTSVPLATANTLSFVIEDVVHARAEQWQQSRSLASAAHAALCGLLRRWRRVNACLETIYVVDLSDDLDLGHTLLSVLADVLSAVVTRVGKSQADLQEARLRDLAAALVEYFAQCADVNHLLVVHDFLGRLPTLAGESVPACLMRELARSEAIRRLFELVPKPADRASLRQFTLLEGVMAVGIKILEGYMASSAQEPLKWMDSTVEMLAFIFADPEQPDRVLAVSLRLFNRLHHYSKPALPGDPLDTPLYTSVLEVFGLEYDDTGLLVSGILTGMDLEASKLTSEDHGTNGQTVHNWMNWLQYVIITMLNGIKSGSDPRLVVGRPVMSIQQRDARIAGLLNARSRRGELTTRSLLLKNMFGPKPKFVETLMTLLLTLRPPPAPGSAAAEAIGSFFADPRWRRLVCANADCEQRATGKPTKMCSRCRSVSYCSVECQKADWPGHKKTCKPS